MHIRRVRNRILDISAIDVRGASGYTSKVMKHPGIVLREEHLASISVAEAALRLGVYRPTLSRVINGRAGISPRMAIKISQVFGGRSPEDWVTMQALYNLDQVRGHSLTAPEFTSRPR
jgi:addiction module HigA family antidote